MAMKNPYQQYKQNTVDTASPGELTLMLYKGCIKFVKLGRKGMENKNIEEKNYNLQRAQAIIQELMVTLNTDVEVSKNMLQMYDYMNRRLMEANTKNDLEILDEVEGYLIEFMDVWKQILQETRQQKFQESGRA